MSIKSSLTWLKWSTYKGNVGRKLGQSWKQRKGKNPRNKSFQYHSDTDKENTDTLGLALLAELFFCEIDIQSNVNKYY